MAVKKEKTIYCPKCKRRVATYDGRSSNNVIVNCKNCKKRVVYYFETDETVLKEIPIREQGSGKRFY